MATRDVLLARLIDATGIDPAALTPRQQRLLGWLAGLDDHTTDALVDLLAAVRDGEQAVA